MLKRQIGNDMNIAANPVVEADQTVYLKDYQKPVFLVDSINLDIQVYAEHSQVVANLVMKRQTEDPFSSHRRRFGNAWDSANTWCGLRGIKAAYDARRICSRC